jgi:putative addiction module component (TIGR02574 family)
MTEKLCLVEELWNFIAFNDNELPISKAQQQELDKRYKDYQAGNVVLHDWQDVRNGLRAKYQ